MRSIVCVLFFVLLLGCGAIFFGATQPRPSGPAEVSSFLNPQQEPPRRRNPDDPFEKMQKDNEKRMNKERQESIKKDTDRLLELATELKMSVDKSSENTLSVDVMKKAEEIERLAHRVRDKMKGS